MLNLKIVEPGLANNLLFRRYSRFEDQLQELGATVGFRDHKSKAEFTPATASEQALRLAQRCVGLDAAEVPAQSQRRPQIFEPRPAGELITAWSQKQNLGHMPERHTAVMEQQPQCPIARIRAGHEKVMRGELDPFPTIEWYIHTEADPSLRDAKGHHNSALFVQWVPYQLSGTTWEKEEDRYVKQLLAIADRFAPGTSDLVVDTFTLTPPKIEQHFGITGGHIHHVDNTLAMDQRVPYTTPLSGLYSCSAGCHPAGSVLGGAGHNAAQRILADLGLPHE